MSQEPDIFEEDNRPKKELRLLGALCYVPFGFILPYALSLDNQEFTSFHIKQSSVLLIVTFFLSLLPFIGWGWPWLAYTVIAGYTGYQAYQGEKFMFGFIRAIATKVLEMTNKNGK